MVALLLERSRGRNSKIYAIIYSSQPCEELEFNRHIYIKDPAKYSIVHHPVDVQGTSVSRPPSTIR
jgi:hypothetical protein